MAEYRRKKIFIDKIFQGKFLFLFLLLTVLTTLGNIIYLFMYLKDEVENNIYRSRFVISNVNEIIADNVISFNTGLLVMVVVLAGIFYFFVRRRITNYLKKLENALHARRHFESKKDLVCALPAEFADINEVLTDFFDSIDNRIAQEKEAIVLLQHFVEAPDKKTKEAVLKKLKTLSS